MEPLIRQYVEGWIEGNVSKILGTLADDCTIIESHGPVYRGTGEVRSWAENWIKDGSKVNKWEIISLSDIPPDRAVFEWHFECTVDGQEHSLDGISIVQFKNGKIGFMREYRSVKN